MSVKVLPTDGVVVMASELGRQGVRGGGRRVWASKGELLAGGADVKALTYERASQDKKKQGKSVDDQRKLNVEDVNRHGWRLAASFKDNDVSASRYGTKERHEFEKLMAAIRAGKGDVLVVWEISRRERDLAVYVSIRDTCVQVGMFFWLVGGVLYDLRDRNDRMMLGMQAVQAEFTADYIRDNVIRGINGAAADGRPHGRVTYGYRRVYNTRTKALERQEPDTEMCEAIGADGVRTWFNPADVVRSLFADVIGGVPLIIIERRLNAKGIPGPRGGLWGRKAIRKMVLNPAYAGKRVLRGDIVGEGKWEPLVDEETYWSAARLLQDPDRTTTRAGRAVHLLSYIACCDVCGGPLSAQMQKGVRKLISGERVPTKPLRMYKCLERACTSVLADALDSYVERTMIAWLSRPDVAETLNPGTDDKDVSDARAEAQRLRADLEQYRELAEAGDVEPASFVRIEKGLRAKITAAEERAVSASVPPVLRGRIGEHAVTAWNELADDRAEEIPVKREIIRAVAQIRVKREGAGTTLTPDRINWRWITDTDGDPGQMKPAS